MVYLVLPFEQWLLDRLILNEQILKPSQFRLWLDYEAKIAENYQYLARLRGYVDLVLLLGGWRRRLELEKVWLNCRHAGPSV